MTAVAPLRADDLDRMFADWSVPVILKRITQTATPASGEVAESSADFLLTAIVKPRTTDPTAGTAHQHATITTEFLIRTADLPAVTNLSTSRLALGDVEFSVIGSETSGDGLTITILGQRV
jgi:hypothetical protein